MSEQIKAVNMLDQYKEDLTIYSIEANIRRAIPATDGLKLVHRRILYTMFKMHLDGNQFSKSARITGNVLKLHAHGNLSAYDALKPMTNWFEIGIPLIDNQGSFGTIQGDSAAAERYTEAKLSKFAVEAVIGELADNKDIVDWLPSFDNTDYEPETLPVAVPLALVNGAFGIGVGTTCSIPKHNLGEVIDATIAYINNPNINITLVPDLCQTCDIIESDFESMSKLGRGKFTARGIIDIEQIPIGRSKQLTTCLVIKSTPDLVFLNSVADKITELIGNKKLVNIVDMYDESTIAKKPGDPDILRYVIVLRPGTDPNYLREMIYKMTEMEKTYNVNFELIHGVNPMRFSYKSYIEFFVMERKLTKFRSYCLKLKKVKTRAHELSMYIKIIESKELDNLLKLIRKNKSSDSAELAEFLCNKIGITDVQSEFILNLNLRNLSEGYLIKYKEEVAKLNKLIVEYTNMITDDNLILNEIINELLYFKNKYNTPRRCRVISSDSLSQIPAGEFKIILTENGYIKKVSVNDSIGNFKNDKPIYVLKVDNRKDILLFDDQGRVFNLAVHKIPLVDRTIPNGVDLRTILKNATSNIISIMYLPKLKEFSERVRQIPGTNMVSKYYITIITNQGTVKKIDIKDILTTPPSGLIYIKLKDGDYVKDINVIDDSLDVIIYAKNKALRISHTEIKELKRNAVGIKAMNADVIDGMSIVYPNSTHIFILTKNGKYKLIDVTALPRSARAKSGTSIIKSPDEIQSIYGVNINDSVSIYTKNDSYEFNICELNISSSISACTKLIPIKNDVIISCKVNKSK